MDNEDIENYLAEQGLSDSSERTYRWHLRQFVRETAVDADHPNAREGRAWLDSHRWGSSTRWSTWCMCRALLRWRFGEGHPALRLKLKREASAPGRALREGQVQKLLASFDTMTVKGIRDLALCAVMLDTGLRASEVCRLEMDHVDLESCSLSVKVKGGKWGRGVFSQATGRYLAEWLAVRERIGPKVETVFVSLGGFYPHTAMVASGLRRVVVKWGEKIGIKLSPHDLRRTFATCALRAGAPSRVVQVAGRWSDLKMVERYSQQIEAEDMAPWFPVK